MAKKIRICLSRHGFMCFAIGEVKVYQWKALKVINPECLCVCVRVSVCACVCVRVWPGKLYGKMSPQRWQYLKSLNVFCDG